MMKKIVFPVLCIVCFLSVPVLVPARTPVPGYGLTSIAEPQFRLWHPVDTGSTGALPVHHAPYNDTVLLPMTLLEFMVRQVDNNCYLLWKAVREEYSKPFRVERSIDGKSFVEIGSTLGNGHEIGLQLFDFTDHGAAGLGTKTIYYRLRQLNAEGVSEYTHVLALSVNYKGSFATIFPNPAFDHVNLMVHVSRQEQLGWSLVDLSGRMLRSGQPRVPAGSSVIHIDLKTLPPGIYFLQSNSPTVISRLKLLKL